MKKALATFSVLIGLGLSLPGFGRAQLVLYDDFGGGDKTGQVAWNGVCQRR